MGVRAARARSKSCPALAGGQALQVECDQGNGGVALEPGQQVARLHIELVAEAGHRAKRPAVAKLVQHGDGEGAALRHQGRVRTLRRTHLQPLLVQEERVHARRPGARAMKDAHAVGAHDAKPGGHGGAQLAGELRVAHRGGHPRDEDHGLDRAPRQGTQELRRPDGGSGVDSEVNAPGHLADVAGHPVLDLSQAHHSSVGIDEGQVAARSGPAPQIVQERRDLATEAVFRRVRGHPDDGNAVRAEEAFQVRFIDPAHPCVGRGGGIEGRKPVEGHEPPVAGDREWVHFQLAEDVPRRLGQGRVALGEQAEGGHGARHQGEVGKVSVLRELVADMKRVAQGSGRLEAHRRKEEVGRIVLRGEELRVVAPLAQGENRSECGVLTQTQQHLVAQRLRVGDVLHNQKPVDGGRLAPAVPRGAEMRKHLLTHARHDELHVEHVAGGRAFHAPQLLLVGDGLRDDLHDHRGSEPAQVGFAQVARLAHEQVARDLEPRGRKDAVHLVLEQRAATLPLGDGEDRIDRRFHWRLPAHCSTSDSHGRASLCITRP